MPHVINESKHRKHLNYKDQWYTDFPAGSAALPMFCGERGIFSPARLGWLFMSTKLVWCAKKRVFRNVKIRKLFTFVHEAHKLVPKDKKTLSTKGSLKCS